MIQLKPGVRIHILSPQAVLGMMIVNGEWEEYSTDLTMVITSVCEGKHSDKSKHYLGCAFDVRIPTSGSNFLDECRKALGPDWDCIDETDHWHFEYDPSGRPW